MKPRDTVQVVDTNFIHQGLLGMITAVNIDGTFIVEIPNGQRLTLPKNRLIPSSLKLKWVTPKNSAPRLELEGSY
jgi:hypothetical protein